MDDARFIEFCQIARRFPPAQRDQLSDWLLEARLKALGDTPDHDLRLLIDDNPFGFTEADDLE